MAAEVVVPAEDSEESCVLADEAITKDIDGLGEKYDFTDNNNSYFIFSYFILYHGLAFILYYDVVSRLCMVLLATNLSIPLMLTTSLFSMLSYWFEILAYGYNYTSVRIFCCIALHAYTEMLCIHFVCMLYCH